SISIPAVSSASSIAFLMESTAASRLTTTPRRIPREAATPIPMMSSAPSSVASPTIAEIFAVPTSSPTRYRSFRATDPPLKRFSGRRWSAGGNRGCAPARPDVHAFLKPQIDVIDVGHPLTQRRCDFQVRPQAFEELVLSEVQLRRIVVEQHHRVVKIGHVDLRDPCRNLPLPRDRIQDAGGELSTCGVHGGGTAPGPPPGAVVYATQHN